MKEECIICKSPLKSLKRDELLECVICHKNELSKTMCKKGHYICNECQSRGWESIVDICLNVDLKSPVKYIRRMMRQPSFHMHGPEHHIMVGAALLAAYKNSGGDIDLLEGLQQIIKRAQEVPGGACGSWGACGAGISTGIFMSVILGSNPFAEEEWGLSIKMTSKSLEAIGKIGGPRCCKRNSYLSILSAIDFVKEHLGVEMEGGKIDCVHLDMNDECIGDRCPFFP